MVPTRQLPVRPSAVGQGQGTPRAWGTLPALRGLRLLLFSLASFLLAGELGAAHQSEVTLHASGQEILGAIASAQQVRAALVAMDAESANVLLASPGEMLAADDTFDARRAEVAHSLMDSAEQITLGERQRTPLDSLQIDLGNYERTVQRARDLRAGGRSAQVEAYLRAAALMDRKLLPEVDGLLATETRELLKLGSAEQRRFTAERTLATLVGGLGVMALCGAQIFLSRRTRRTFNPALLAATLVGLAGLGSFLALAGAAGTDLGIATGELYPSMNLLWQARTADFVLEGDLSRSLLVTGNSEGYEAEATAETRKVGTLPHDLTAAELLGAAREGRTAIDGFGGYLADELPLVHGVEEREAFLRVLEAWQGVGRREQTFWQLRRAGQLDTARLLLSVPGAAGHPGDTWQSFDQSLKDMLVLERGAMEATIGDGIDSARKASLVAFASAALVIGLVLMGFAPRLREYKQP